MLEAMQERQISIGNTTYKLPSIFIVIATQNPIEQEGTYLLSEAQLDRFYLKETIKYPSPVEEVEVLNRIEKNVFVSSDPVLKLEDLSYLQGLAQRVYIDESIKKYIVDIVAATRDAKKYIPANLADYIVLGSSTRGAIAFMECAKALALINGRSYVIPEDIKALRYNVLRHRIILNFAASADNVTVENVIDAIIGAIKTP